MRAITVNNFGGPDAYAWAEIERPKPALGQILAEVHVAGINFLDSYQRQGKTPVRAPFVAGVEGVGVIVEIGEGVTGLSVGQRIGWLAAQGSFAEYVAVEAAKAVPIPDAVDDQIAAALLLQGIAAHYLATDAYQIRRGDPVLVHAAAGGVGQLLTQIAKIRGGVVIGTVSSEPKAEIARAAGADHVLFYEGFADAARQLTKGMGVAAVYDSVGASTFDGSLAALRVRGTLVSYGTSSGPTPALELHRLMAGGSLSVLSTMIAHYTRTREELLSRTDALFAWAAKGELKVSIGGRYSISQASDALAELEARKTTGKLLLIR